MHVCGAYTLVSKTKTCLTNNITTTNHKQVQSHVLTIKSYYLLPFINQSFHSITSTECTLYLTDVFKSSPVILR